MKEKYRRIAANQIKAEEALMEQQGLQRLQSFRWDAPEMNQPLLPTLNRAIHESGGDAQRAWGMFDRRSDQF